VHLLVDFGGPRVHFSRQRFSALPTVDADCFRHLFTHLSPINVITLVRLA
jgi:hypothetical protein